MKILSDKQGPFVIMVVKGRMDVTTAPKFVTACTQWLDKGEKTFLVDVGQLEYISSAGLRSISSVGMRLRATQGKLVFCNMKGMVQEVFKTTGFSRLFSIYPTIPQALMALTQGGSKPST